MPFPIDIPKWDCEIDYKVAIGYLACIPFCIEDKDCKAIDITNKAVVMELRSKDWVFKRRYAIQNTTIYWNTQWELPNTTEWFDATWWKWFFPLYWWVMSPTDTEQKCCYEIRCAETNASPKTLFWYWEICFVDVSKC